MRDDFLNPFFRAPGWDMENRAGLIQKEREVEIESATQIGGGRKRGDYLYIVDRTAGKLPDEISGRDGVSPSLTSTKDAGGDTPSLPTLSSFEKQTAALRLLDPACGSEIPLAKSGEAPAGSAQRADPARKCFSATL